MPHTPPQIAVRVAAVDILTPIVKAFRLVAADGAPLPGFAPGAHIAVRIPPDAGGGRAELWRSYSLVHLDPATDPATPRPDYRIAVRLEEAGRGGSRHMHEGVRPGDEIVIRAPSNDFPLDATADDAVILVAGGIGITPIASMATALLAAGKPFELHYCGRSADQMAYRDELRALFGPALRLYTDDRPGDALSVDRLLAASRTTQPIHVCGPAGMINAVLTKARERGWPDDALHCESFAAAAPLAGDRPFEVLLQASGRLLTVPADRTLLDVLTDAGVSMVYDCRSGYCGLCSVRVLSGAIDHRDSYLLDQDRASGTVMQACVSRAGSDRLVLEL